MIFLWNINDKSRGYVQFLPIHACDHHCSELGILPNNASQGKRHCQILWNRPYFRATRTHTLKWWSPICQKSSTLNRNHLSSRDMWLRQKWNWVLSNSRATASKYIEEVHGIQGQIQTVVWWCHSLDMKLYQYLWKHRWWYWVETYGHHL